jgi:iron complex outermembrane receptor protein
MRNSANGQPLRGITGFFNLTTLSASLKHDFNEHFSVAFRTAIDRRDFAAQNFFSTLLSDTATEKVNSTWSHMQLAYNKGRHRLSADIGYKQTIDEFRLRKSVPANINRSQLIQILLQHEIKLNENTSINYGSQTLIRNITSNDRGDHGLLQSALFLTLQHQFGNLKINPSLRLDYHENAGWEWIPQMNMSYKKGKIQWRGMLGKSTRDADFTERFNNYRRNPVPSGNRIGNPLLSAETSFNYEFGGDYFLSNTLKLSTSWFQRFHNNLIDWVRTTYDLMPRRENLTPAAVVAIVVPGGTPRNQTK